MTPEQFKRLAEMFEAVLQQPAEDRRAYVRTLTDGNEEMRRELEALVASHREDDTFLESGIFTGTNEPLQKGQPIAQYMIQDEIGRGGMGVVYRALDTRLNREVAIKALGRHLLSDVQQRERFRREALAAASISHPAVATIYALEEVDGHFYIVSEYVPGETLQTIQDQNRLSIREALQTALRIAEGLAAAHAKGVVHRDLKPGNVIRTPEGQPKIVDFGLARLPESDSVDQTLTQAGQILGSPPYMSPEQLRGEPIDFRADIFSFGILLYELVNGHHPFHDQTSAGTTAAILAKEPPPAEGIDRRLDRFIRRCLQKAPRDRYLSTPQLVEDLRALSTVPQTHTTLPRDAEGQLTSHWWSFHQTAVTLMYAAVVVVLWDVREDAGTATIALFFGVLASAIANGTLRAHLLFTSRFNPAALRSEMKRVSPWKHRIDWFFTGLLLATAATILPGLQLIAGILAGVAVGHLVVFLVIEPATSAAVFPDPDSPES